MCEVDFVEMMKERASRQKAMEELARETRKEVELINEKHQDVLAEYYPESDKLKSIISEFNAKWGVKLKDYNKEMAAVKKRYRKLAKSI